MARILDKYYEADDVSVASGTPLSPGEKSRDIVVPNEEIWEITAFGGSSDFDCAEVILLYSEDGTNFIHPYDDQASNNRVRKLHMKAGTPGEIPLLLKIIGDGTKKIRLLARNYNTSETIEVVLWIRGNLF
ncbi:hypothetical protein IIA15_01075 [candidate division TA06 bacterium]|nr:hypothetical protein [candidate division TA06 bacterium]